MSYLFIAIIWINHHHLMRFVGRPTLRLIWINFAHLFPVSFLPFATAWVARSRLAAAPVAVYAALFVCIDLAYNVFEREVLEQAHVTVLSHRARRLARVRSLAVLGIFITAALTAFVSPHLGFALVCCGLVPHVKPEPLGGEPSRAVKRTAGG